MTKKYTKDNPPPMVSKKWDDVLLGSDSIWCSVGGGEPFCNEIFSVQESEDGTGVWFLMDSHNTIFCKFEETIDVVEADLENMSSFKLNNVKKASDVVKIDKENLSIELRAVANMLPRTNKEKVLIFTEDRTKYNKGFYCEVRIVEPVDDVESNFRRIVQVEEAKSVQAAYRACTAAIKVLAK